MQLIAHLRRLFEFQILRVIEHEFFQAFDFLADLLLAHRLILRSFLRRLQFFARSLRAIDAVDQFADAFLDPDRRDVIGSVEGNLPITSRRSGSRKASAN
jgi:hypothetical protein